MSGRGRGLAAAAVLLAWSVGARADEPQPPPPPERIKAAADEFDRGRRAFLSKDFAEAAVHFENANRDAPRAETLRLAIRARREAKQLARAATLAAVARARYVDDASTAQLAQLTLDEATPALHELVIRCAKECSVTADGRVVSQSDATEQRIFLDPGPHELGIGFSQGAVAKHVEATKGGREALSFEPPAAPPASVPAATPPVKPTPPDTPPPSPKPLGPVVFFVGAGLTVAAGAATALSGLDTLKNPGVDTVRRECAGKDPSCQAYQDGRSAQLRTNILLAVTGGVGLATGVVGLFFTNWGGARRPTTVGVTPSGLVVSGRF